MLALYITLLDTDEQISKFERIYTKYRGLMFYTANSVLQDSYLAEDAVHETFLDIIRIIDSIRATNKKELSQFLRIMTHHKAVDMVQNVAHRKNAITKLTLPVVQKSIQQKLLLSTKFNTKTCYPSFNLWMKNTKHRCC